MRPVTSAAAVARRQVGHARGGSRWQPSACAARPGRQSAGRSCLRGSAKQLPRKRRGGPNAAAQPFQFCRAFVQAQAVASASGRPSSACHWPRAPLHCHCAACWRSAWAGSCAVRGAPSCCECRAVAVHDHAAGGRLLPSMQPLASRRPCGSTEALPVCRETKRPTHQLAVGLPRSQRVQFAPFARPGSVGCRAASSVRWRFQPQLVE